MRNYMFHAMLKISSSPISLLPWAARSPDLSPIGHVLSMIRECLLRHAATGGTPDALWLLVEAAWAVISQHHIQRFFQSIPRRVAAVTDIRGSTLHTDFLVFFTSKNAVYKIN